MFLLASLIVAKCGIHVSFCPVLQAELVEKGMVRLPATATAGRSIPPKPLPLVLHPFYRLPVGHTGGLLPVFDGAAALAGPAGNQLVFFLKLLRPLFAKDILSQEELEVLHNCAYSLVGYSSKWSASDFEGLKPWHRLAPLAYRFLAVDALWSICHILGPSVMKTDEWWGQFMERIAAPASLLDYGERLPLFYVRDLTAKFMNALDMFKRGERPSAPLLVEIKQRIYGVPSIGSKFKRPSWDLWRTDDAKFRSMQK